MAFQISGLPADAFSHLYGQSNKDLQRLGVRRTTAESSPGYPCRVSLRDADLEDSVLLMNYCHQDARTPYQSTHAIFVIEGAQTAQPEVNEIPLVLARRVLSVRGFDRDGNMVAATLAEGAELAAEIEIAFSNRGVDYLHLHNAAPGCYAARVDRA